MTSISGRNVVVTGKIAGETRVSAEAKLRSAGAFVQSSVTRDTHELVTGEAVGATKVNAARAKGVEIVPWEQAKLLLQPGAGPTAPDPSSNGGGMRKPPLAGRPAIAPMLAKASEDGPPLGDGWLYEIKWDGYRCIATVADGSVSLASRSGKPLDFPQIEQALEDVPDCVLDGELVVLDEQGRSDFQALGNGHTGAVYVAFDMVECVESVRHFPLEARKELLRELIAEADATRVSESPVFEDGDALLEHARSLGLEGIVAKRKGSTYQDGRRGPAWLKIKLRQEQEFVVAGWKPGEGSRSGRIGALVLAVNDDGGDHLVYAGRCGTGFDEAELDRLLALFEERDASPLAETPRGECRNAVWVEPNVVVQVEFQRWTGDGRLWHSSYKGLRIDKGPGDVRREPERRGA